MIAARFTAAKGRWLIRIARWLEAAATGCADHVIVVSEECRKRVIARGVGPAKISVVLNTTPWWPAVREKPSDDREGGDSSSSSLTQHSFRGTVWTSPSAHSPNSQPR